MSTVHPQSPCRKPTGCVYTENRVPWIQLVLGKHSRHGCSDNLLVPARQSFFILCTHVRCLTLQGFHEHSTNFPCLHDLAFAMPSSWNAFPSSWIPDKYLLQVTSTGSSWHLLLPGSHRSYTLDHNYLILCPPQNSIVGSPRESLHLQWLARALHRGLGVRLVCEKRRKRVSLMGDRIGISRGLTCQIHELNPTGRHLTEVNVMFCTCISNQWLQHRRGAQGEQSLSWKGSLGHPWWFSGWGSALQCGECSLGPRSRS